MYVHWHIASLKGKCVVMPSIVCNVISWCHTGYIDGSGLGGQPDLEAVKDLI